MATSIGACPRPDRKAVSAQGRAANAAGPPQSRSRPCRAGPGRRRPWRQRLECGGSSPLSGEFPVRLAVQVPNPRPFLAGSAPETSARRKWSGYEPRMARNSKILPAVSASSALLSMDVFAARASSYVCASCCRALCCYLPSSIVRPLWLRFCPAGTSVVLSGSQPQGTSPFR